MWTSTDFSGFGNGSDTGGGFLAGGTGLQGKKMSPQPGIVPCTCAEIAIATQEGDKFLSPTGIEFSQVTLVGVIRSVNESATRIDYEIDDHTGPFLQVKMFVDDDESSVEGGKSRPLRELTYVRVYGHVRSFQGSRNVVAFKVFPLTDMNQITCHILETIYARMLHAKANAPGPDNAQNNFIHMDTMSGSAATVGGLTVLQNQVLSSVRLWPEERGISVAQINEKLRGVPERQIREDLDFLSAEGHVYSTIDDDHFRATEA